MLFRSGSRSEREAAALAAARAPKPRRAQGGTRAPRGEVTTSNVADRAQAASETPAASTTTDSNTEGSNA